MSEEETIERILHYLEGAINTYIEGTKVTKVEISVEDDEILLNYISNLQKENEELKETLKCTQDSWFNDTQKLDKLQKENSKLNKENQALYESINCDDDNMLAREYQKLKKELDKKDKVIEKAFKYIDEHTYRDMEECEFGETNNLTCIKDCDTCIKQYFYKQVEKVGGENK